jgi:hypothetical protein
LGLREGLLKKPISLAFSRPTYLQHRNIITAQVYMLYKKISEWNVNKSASRLYIYLLISSFAGVKIKYYYIIVIFLWRKFLCDKKSASEMLKNTPVVFTFTVSPLVHI